MSENPKQLFRTCTACGEKVFYQRRKKPKTCPFCEDIYWDKPKDERNLFLLQDKFLEGGRDPNILGEMYFGFVSYSENIIKKELNKTGKIISKDDLDEKAQEIAILLTEYFLKNPEAYVQNSFGGMLIRISKGVLYSTKAKRIDSEFSLESKLYEDFEVQENIEFFIEDPLAKQHFEDKYNLDAHDEFLKNNITKVLNELSNLIQGMAWRIRESQGYTKSIYFLIGLKHFLDKSNSASLNDYYNFCSVQDRQNIENAKLLLRRYLLNRLQF